MSEKKEYLVKSSWSCRYSLGFESIEIVSEGTLKRLNELKQEKFTFFVREWAGKHSEGDVELNDDDFKIISESKEDIEWFRKMFGEYVGNICFSDCVLETYNEQ